jgi:hypothetical protein
MSEVSKQRLDALDHTAHLPNGIIKNSDLDRLARHEREFNQIKHSPSARLLDCMMNLLGWMSFP